MRHGEVKSTEEIRSVHKQRNQDPNVTLNNMATESVVSCPTVSVVELQIHSILCIKKEKALKISHCTDEETKAR